MHVSGHHIDTWRIDRDCTSIFGPSRVDCGFEDIRILEFDHIRGSKKKSISRLLSIDAPWKAIQAEIEKWIRCANCHRIKTNEQGVFGVASLLSLTAEALLRKADYCFTST